METGIKINGTKKRTVKELGKVIMDILNGDCDELTKQVALKTLSEGVQVHTLVEGCTLGE